MITQDNIIKSLVILFAVIVIIVISLIIPIKKLFSSLTSEQEQIITSKNSDKIEFTSKY